jgi:hypothetical protein
VGVDVGSGVDVGRAGLGVPAGCVGEAGDGVSPGSSVGSGPGGVASAGGAVASGGGGGGGGGGTSGVSSLGGSPPDGVGVSAEGVRVEGVPSGLPVATGLPALGVPVTVRVAAGVPRTEEPSGSSPSPPQKARTSAATKMPAASAARELMRGHLRFTWSPLQASSHLEHDHGALGGIRTHGLSLSASGGLYPARAIPV